MRAADGTQGHEIWEKGEKMNRRTFEEMVSYFNQTVADMDIDRKYKMELLGMITAILQRHDEDMKHAPAIEERKTGEWLHELLQDAIDAGIITENQASRLMDIPAEDNT